MNDAAQFLIGHGGLVLFAFVFVEQAGLPFPVAPWLLAAGALSASGKLNPVPVIGLVALAAIMADSLWFYIGRRGGQRVLRLFCRVSLARDSCVGRTKNLFEHHGLQALVAAKFLPGLGAVMPPLAGAMGMSTSRFLVFDGLGSLFYGASYIVAGFVFHNQLQETMASVNRLGFSALLLALVLVTGYIALKYARRRNFAGEGSRKNKTANQRAEAAIEDASVTTGGAYNSAASPPAAESLNTLEFQKVVLAARSSSPRSVVAQTSGPLLPNSL